MVPSGVTRCPEAWRGLLELGPVAALPLVTATSDPRPEVAMRAFHILGRLRADGEPALPRLREHLAGKDPQLAAAAGRCVRELDGGGKEVWKFADLEDPYYAQRLPDGHTVISMLGIIG